MTIHASDRVSSSPPRHPEVSSLPTRLGRFQLLEVLGRGGMGHVYLAVGPEGRVALKMVDAATAPAELHLRFYRENLALQRFSHPNSVRVLSKVDKEGDWLFYAMEYVEGLPLHRLLSQVGSLGPELTKNLWRQIASAVAAAHSMGLLHRDLKPANVMIEERSGGVAKLVDFGLARLVGATDDPRLSASGAFLGTPGYMPPEAYISSHHVDTRSDVFQLGLLAFAMLCGRNRFHRIDTEFLRTDQASQTLYRLIARCISPDPDARFADAGELVEALHQAPLESTDTPVDIQLPECVLESPVRRGPTTRSARPHTSSLS
ncbi:MAG: serine/threonine-protein kinase [Myxococcota bacterium]